MINKTYYKYLALLLILTSQAYSHRVDSSLIFLHFDQDISHAAWQDPDFMGVLYELPGGKSNLHSTVSLMPGPALRIPFSNYGSDRHLPHLLGGYWSVSAHDTLLRNRLTPHGHPDEFRIHLPKAVNDTPYIDIHWQRGAFTGNIFKTRFERLIAEQTRFSLWIESHSTDSSAPFTYQDITHQPYLTWPLIKRDSTTIPFEGKAHKVDSRFMGLGLSHRIPGGEWWIRTGFHNNLSQLPEWFKRDTLHSFSHFQPIAKETYLGTGVEVHFRPCQMEVRAERSAFSTQYKNTSFYTPSHQDLATQNLFVSDTARYSGNMTVHKVSGQLHSCHEFLPDIGISSIYHFQEKMPRNPLQPQDHYPYDTDVQLGTLGYHLEFPNHRHRAEVGLKRFSHPLNTVDYSPEWASTHTWFVLPSRGHLELDVSSFTYLPEFRQAFLYQSSELNFPNPYLQARRMQRIALHAQSRWEHMEPIVGIRGESSTNHPLLKAWRTGFANEIADSLAFGWDQAPMAINIVSFSGIRLHWRGWSTALYHHRSILQRLEYPNNLVGDSIPLFQQISWSGDLSWKKSLLDHKLKIFFVWNWQWHPGTMAYLPQGSGNAIRSDLGKYLALDFMGKMRIRDFELFYRINNKYHDEYFTGPGYRPPGVQLAYGVNWILRN
jgi:hypothetical protein